jgi:hypothetical protein
MPTELFDPFPLGQWFDLARRISPSDIELCSAQMALYAYKDGDDPDGPRVRRAVRSLKHAARNHNRSLRNA